MDIGGTFTGLLDRIALGLFRLDRSGCLPLAGSLVTLRLRRGGPLGREVVGGVAGRGGWGCQRLVLSREWAGSGRKEGVA